MSPTDPERCPLSGDGNGVCFGPGAVGAGSVPMVNSLRQAVLGQTIVLPRSDGSSWYLAAQCGQTTMICTTESHRTVESPRSLSYAIEATMGNLKALRIADCGLRIADYGCIGLPCLRLRAVRIDATTIERISLPSWIKADNNSFRNISASTSNSIQ